MSKRRNALNAVALGSCAQVSAKPSMPRPDPLPCLTCGPYRVDQDPSARYWRTIVKVVAGAANR